MKTSTLKNNVQQAIFGLASAIFWVLLWYGISQLVQNEIILPSPAATLNAWGSLALTGGFWLDAFLSLLRVFIGFSFGVLAGVCGAFLTSHNKPSNILLSPLLRIIRAAPVASFIILALVWIQTDILPVFIAFITVLPIVWGQTEQAITSVDSDLLEMAKIMRVGKLKTLLRIQIPWVLPSIGAAAVTSLGFGWKSAVAAEVICRPVLSLGGRLQSAKIYLETPQVFAVTLTIIVLSLILEKLLKVALKRLSEVDKR